MSAMIKEVYDAFVEAGVSEEKSTLAAKAIADYDNRFSRIESDLLILKWMVGLVIAAEILPLLKGLVAQRVFGKCAGKVLNCRDMDKYHRIECPRVTETKKGYVMK